MNQTEKKKNLDELQSKYKRMMEKHSNSNYIANEGSHLDSALALKAIYTDIYELSLEINEPVPFWF